MAAPSASQRGRPDVLDTGFLKLVSVAFLLLGAIFGLMQPAASVGLGPAGAVVFWMLHAAAAIPCLVTAVWGLARLQLRLRPWAFVAVSGVIAAVGFSLAALGLEFAFAVQDNDPSEPMLLESWGFAGLWLDEFSGVAPPFMLAWVLINLPRLMRLGLSTGPVPSTLRPAPAVEAGPTVLEPQPRQGPAPTAGAAPDGLLEQLPEALGTDLVLLSSDLHYLHVHTPRGRTMLLYNLSAAEAELGERGTRVHRSHWVASHHVLGLRRRGSQLVCQLTGGLEAPVSRRRQAEMLARFGRDSRYHPPVPGAQRKRPDAV
jgi:hypothetical protein